MILSAGCKADGITWPSKGRAELSYDRARVPFPDKVLLQESDTLFHDPQFEKHPRLLNCACVCAYVRRRQALEVTPLAGIVPFRNPIKGQNE
jgi:hypothetical protein